MSPAPQNERASFAPKSSPERLEQIQARGAYVVAVLGHFAGVGLGDGRKHAAIGEQNWTMLVSSILR